MKIGFSQKTITPTQNIELVGFIPSRISTSIEKDLYLKVIVIQRNDKNYIFLTADLLGFDIYYKTRILKSLQDEGIAVEYLQIFATHTHSAPLCLNERQYFTEGTSEKDLFINFNDELSKEYFDLLEKQGILAIKESLNDLEAFTYKIGRGKMKDFQTNRIDPSYESFDDILCIEIIRRKDKSLLYSFSGHPTILDRNSTKISPDYIGVVSKQLSHRYPFNIFFNAPCGDMSTRFTKKNSSLSELNRLGTLAATHVLKTCDSLSEEKTLTEFSVETFEVALKYKNFLSLEDAKHEAQRAQDNYEFAKHNQVGKQELRALKSNLEGALVNVHHSQQNYQKDEYMMPIDLIIWDQYTLLNIESEVFSSLILDLSKGNIWVNSLSGQYKTYLCDQRAYELKTYESLSSLYKINEGEKLIEVIHKTLKEKKLK